MSKVSVIIPARNEPFLQQTIDDVLVNAAGDVEVLAMLDNYWPDPPLKKDRRVITVHFGQVVGMRDLINAAARIATGDFLMKLDAHCMVGECFDEILAADCGEHEVAVPSRYYLDGEKWERTRGPIDYLMLTFPYNCDDLYGTGFHGRKWHGPHGLEGSYWYLERERKEIKIDEIISFQGSCWFMRKAHFEFMDGLDAKNYNFHQEAAEIGFKTWLSGGRVTRNKKTWYAHLHKGKKYGRGFRLSKRLMVESEIFSTDYWMNNRWPKQTRPLKWLIDKFWPMDGWPKDWDDPKYAQEYEHPRMDLVKE